MKTTIVQSTIIKLQTMRLNTLSFLIMIAVALATFGIAFIPNHSSGSLENKFNIGHAQLFNMYDSSYQRLGHKVGLIALAVMAYFAIVIRKHRDAFQGTMGDSKSKLLRIVKSSAGITLFAGSMATLLDFSGPRLMTLSLLVSCFIVVFSIKFSTIINERRIQLAAWITIVFYLTYLIIPAFFTAPHIRAAELGVVQFHYSIVQAFGDRLAINSDFFSQKLPHYGLILVSLLGAYQKHFGLLNFGQHILLVQTLQTIFLLTSVLALALWKPQRPAFILFALVLFGTFVGTAHNSVFYPNQSGWRFIGLPLWIVLLISTRNLPSRLLSLLLGCSSGLLILCNLETGIALTFGSLIFLTTLEQHIHWRRMATRLITFVAGTVVAFFTFSLLFKLEFGAWPFSTTSLLTHKLFEHFNAGYGGMPLKMDMLAIFIFTHCAYEAVSISIRWRTRGISSMLRIKLSVTVVVLIWFAYYMNRPDPWNLWTYLFLYSFIAADYLNIRRILLLWRKRSLFALADMRVAALIWLLLPYAIALNINYLFMEISYFKEANSSELATISGVNVRADIVSALKNKMAYLKSMPYKDNTIYLSRDNEFIPLMTRQLNPFDVQDVYLENFGPSGFEQILNTIKMRNPQYIFIDEPLSVLTTTDFAATYRRKFYSKIAVALADRYQEIFADSDWRIFIRTAS